MNARQFIREADKAGAFGQTGFNSQVRYSISKDGVGLGWQETRVGPVLLGFYSRAESLRSGLRWVLRRIAGDLKRKGHTYYFVSVDYDNARFRRLLRFYETVFGMHVYGEHEHGVVLRGRVDKLEV